MKKNYGFVAASTIAALLGSGQTFAAVKIVDGHYCSNNCKGQSDCGGMGNNNGCHGQNDCKGQGWKDVSSEKDCLKVGGKWAKVPSENSDKKSDSQAAPKTETKLNENSKHPPAAISSPEMSSKDGSKGALEKANKKQKANDSKDQK